MSYSLTRDAIRTRQLHVKLGDLDLEGMVEEIAGSAWRALSNHTDLGGAKAEAYNSLKAAIESSLRKHVVAVDVCGLGVICEAGKEYDPWPKYE